MFAERWRVALLVVVLGPACARTSDGESSTRSNPTAGRDAGGEAPEPSAGADAGMDSGGVATHSGGAGGDAALAPEAGAGGSADAGAPSAEPDPAAIERLAKAICSSYERCEPGDLAWAYGSYDHCVARVVLGEGWTASLPGVAASLESCTSAWLDWPCTHVLANDPPPACVSGKRAFGEPCNEYTQCASGACYQEIYKCGTCSSPVAIGSACQDDADCGSDMRCLGGACRAFPSEGEACSDTSPCQANLECVQARCRRPPSTVGASCDPYYAPCDWTQSMSCSGTDAIGNFHCEQFPWSLDQCSGAQQCSDLGSCSANHLCKRHPADGAPCDVDRDLCERPAVCISGFCALPTDMALCGAKGSTADDTGCAPACGGNTPICSAGQCVQCLSGTSRCADTSLQACGPDGAWRAAVPCDADAPECVDGACVQPPSCRGLASNCGPSQAESCCLSLPVPGGPFLLGYDGVGATDKGNPVTVSPFRLDRFEASVGRFRSFVADYDAWRAAGHPAADEGAQPGVPGSGWDSAWNNDLPADSEALTANANCWAGYTWTYAPLTNEAFPKDCVSWFEAFAFCAWDDARLPTRAEWSFAASGGGEQRVYPWSTPPTSTTLDDSLAVFCNGICEEKAVGSTSPLGDGRYGQADLAGNVWEWGREVVADKRPIFGGSTLTDASYLNATGVHSDLPTSRGTNGIRCARDR